MGWASGSELFSSVIEASKLAIPKKDTRKEFYRQVIEAFQQSDWDTLDECLGADDAYDEVYEEIYPPDDDE